MPAADDLGVEAGAALDIADRNAEMHHRFDRDHAFLPQRLLCGANYHVGRTSAAQSAEPAKRDKAARIAGMALATLAHALGAKRD
jgi:hypothetical protein